MPEKKKAEKPEIKKISKFDLQEIDKLRALIKDAIYDIAPRKTYFKENVAGILKLIKELDKLEKEAKVKKPKATEFELLLKEIIEKGPKKKPMESVETMDKKKRPETPTPMTA